MPIEKKLVLKPLFAYFLKLTNKTMYGTAHHFYKCKYEIGQGMSLAGHDWTQISHHKTVGMGVKFQN